MKQLFAITIVILFFLMSGCESTTNSSQQKQDTTKVETPPDSTLVEELPDSGKVLDAFSGNVWRRINFTSPLIGYFWPSPGGPSTPLLKTTDGGFSWHPLSYTGNLYVLRFYNDNIGLIAADNQNIWRTFDGGVSWESSAPPYSLYDRIKDICFDPSNPSRVWMTGSQKMYNSPDTGRTWSTVTFPDTGNIWGNNIVFTNSLYGWLLCDTKIYKTIDGFHWNRTENTPDQFHDGFALDAVAGGVTVYITSDRVFKTIDGGSNWQQILDHGGFTIAASDNMHFWIGDSWGKIYSTANGGISWTKQYSNRTKVSYFEYIKFFDLSNGIAMGAPLYDSLHNPITPTLFLYTTNGGTTWAQRIPKLKN